ncbi:hypothetical protein ACFLYG_02185 [Chloroflexota bacterium]
MKKIGLLCLAIVLALGTLGVGYAMWDKTLYVDATVETGEVNALWTEAFSNDDGVVTDSEKDDDDNGLDPKDVWLANDTPRYDKDVASCIVTGADTQEMTVTLNNAYPSYFPTVLFDFVNTGTIPVKIQAIEYSVDDGATWVPWDGTLWVVIKVFGATWKIWILAHPFGMHVGDQIDAGQAVQGGFHLHVEQDSDELQDGSFKVRVHLVQWNEYEEPPPPP